VIPSVSEVPPSDDKMLFLDFPKPRAPLISATSISPLPGSKISSQSATHRLIPLAAPLPSQPPSGAPSVALRAWSIVERRLRLGVRSGGLPGWRGSLGAFGVHGPLAFPELRPRCRVAGSERGLCLVCVDQLVRAR